MHHTILPVKTCFFGCDFRANYANTFSYGAGNENSKKTLQGWFHRKGRDDVTTSSGKTKQSSRQAQPHKTYYTISEVARSVGVPSHVLRFWETQFNELKPMKSRGRRYYTQKDISLLRQLRKWLHEEKYTIKGVQRLLASGQKASLQLLEKTEPAAARDDTESRRQLLQEIHNDLLGVRHLLETPAPKVDKKAA